MPEIAFNPTTEIFKNIIHHKICETVALPSVAQVGLNVDWVLYNEVSDESGFDEFAEINQIDCSYYDLAKCFRNPLENSLPDKRMLALYGIWLAEVYSKRPQVPESTRKEYFYNHVVKRFFCGINQPTPTEKRAWHELVKLRYFPNSLLNEDRGLQTIFIIDNYCFVAAYVDEICISYKNRRGIQFDDVISRNLHLEQFRVRRKEDVAERAVRRFISDLVRGATYNAMGFGFDQMEVEKNETGDSFWDLTLRSRAIKSCYFFQEYDHVLYWMMMDEIENEIDLVREVLGINPEGDDKAAFIQYFKNGYRNESKGKISQVPSPLTTNTIKSPFPMVISKWSDLTIEYIDEVTLMFVIGHKRTRIIYRDMGLFDKRMTKVSMGKVEPLREWKVLMRICSGKDTEDGIERGVRARLNKYFKRIFFKMPDGEDVPETPFPKKGGLKIKIVNKNPLDDRDILPLPSDSSAPKERFRASHSPHNADTIFDE